MTLVEEEIYSTTQDVSTAAVPACLPWLENPYRLVGLYEMYPAARLSWVACELLKTSGTRFAGIADDLLDGKSGEEFDKWCADCVEHVRGTLEVISSWCRPFSMPVTKD